MKTRKQILMLLLVMLAGIPTLSAQTKKEKKEQKKEAVRQLIVSEDYKIDVNTAMPMRGRSIPLTSQYSLQIRNDSVFSYLPYYGRAYSVPYGGGSGLIFNAPLKEYTMDMDKKGNAIIKFSAEVRKTSLSSGRKCSPTAPPASMSRCRTVRQSATGEKWIWTRNKIFKNRRQSLHYLLI